MTDNVAGEAPPAPSLSALWHRRARRSLAQAARNWGVALLVPGAFFVGCLWGKNPLFAQALGLLLCAVAFFAALWSLRRHTEDSKALSDALDASGVGVWDWNVVYDRLAWSPQTRQLIGFPPGMLEGGYRDFIARVHPEDRAGITANLEHARDAHTEHRHEYRVVWPDGTVRWLSGVGRFFYTSDGLPVRVTGTVFDSTDRRQTEEALQKSEEQFRRAIVDAPIPILMLAEDGEILQLSREWTRLSGYGKDELRTLRDWVLLAHGPDSADLMEEFARMFASEQGTRELELLIRARSGELRIWSFTASPPGGLRDGRRFLVGMATDVTERRLAEEALHESQDRLRLAVESADLGTWDLNLATRALAWSDRSKEIFALPIEASATYEFFLSRIHPDDRPAVEEALERAVDGADTGEYRADFRCLWSDGTVRWITALGRARFTEGGDGRQAVRVIGTLLDVTERQRAEADLRRAKEAAEAANQAKDQVLSTLGHELRSPLSPVLAMVSAMELDSKVPVEVRQQLAVVRRNVELEVRIINDIQDLATVAGGHLELKIHSTDVAELLAETLETCRGWAPQDLTVELQLAEGDHRIWADSLRLGQAFGTLIENAFRFTPPQETVRISSHHEGVPPRALVLEIVDSGPGIDPEVLSKLFEPFTRGRIPAGRPSEGVGLRLALAKQIVELHGGALSAEPGGKGQGATFTVVLPIGMPPVQPPVEAEVKSPRPPRLSVAGVPAGKGEPVHPLHILMVEDHADTLEWLSKLLTNRGYRVSMAGTVRAALAAVEAAVAADDGIDIVLSDLGLPDGSGLTLMHDLAKRFGMRGIALSGYGLEDDIRKSLEAGFDRHLVKPVRLEELEAAIRQVTGALKQ
jgi:PAS domain S-box-containing protein